MRALASIVVILFVLPSFAAPIFSTEEIDIYLLQLKKKEVVPDHALDIIFDFYKKNRQSQSGLKDQTCLDKKEYRIRAQDGKFKISDLKKGIENENCLCVMDYTQAKTKKRGHCIFLQKGKPAEIKSFHVAHGSGSQEKDGRPTTFTNKLTSTGTTLSGLHLTAATLYTFRGKAKAYGAYSSTGLGLYGVESVNWTAAAVGKVSHGAPYVNDSAKHFFVGRSHGCPAMTPEKAKEILPLCRGRAAWLNYTTEVAERKSVEPLSCPLQKSEAK